MVPEVGSSSRSTVRAVVLLPQPDSPTSARVSPPARRTKRRRPPDRTDLALEHDAAADREVLREVVDLQQRPAALRRMPKPSPCWGRSDVALLIGGSRVRSSRRGGHRRGIARPADSPERPRASRVRPPRSPAASGSFRRRRHLIAVVAGQPGGSGVSCSMSAGTTVRHTSVANLHLRVERAARWHPDQARRRSLDGLEPVGAALVEAGEARQQTERVGVPRVVEDVVGVGVFGDPAGIHDHDPVGVTGHQAEVVGDEHDGGAALLPAASPADP